MSLCNDICVWDGKPTSLFSLRDEVIVTAHKLDQTAKAARVLLAGASFSSDDANYLSFNNQLLTMIGTIKSPY
ncbi:MAG TPA: hypothetical protein VFX97_01375 [Pyrinomonadaceae bacterium]|nr:hypothetical protein [Pyrinomonadaceae bacterium]